METLDKIRKLFLRNFDFREDILKPEASIESLGLDSLDRVEFLFALEQEFDIKIPDREFKINSIQDVVNVVDKLTREQRGTM